MTTKNKRTTTKRATKSAPKRTGKGATNCSTSAKNAKWTAGCVTTGSCKPTAKKGKKASKNTRKGSTSKPRSQELSGITAAILQLVESWGENGKKGSRTGTHGYAYAGNGKTTGGKGNYATSNRSTGTTGSRKSGRSIATFNNGRQSSTRQTANWGN